MSHKKQKQHKPQSIPPQTSSPVPSDDGACDIVIPVLNQLSLLRRAVEKAKEYGGQRIGQFVFVDDASAEDGIEQYCRANGRYLRHKQNLGFAISCNEGVMATTGPYFVLLNSDTEAMPEWLTLLIETMEGNSKVGIVAPLLTFPPAVTGQPNDTRRPPGMVQSAGFAINIAGQPYHRLLGWHPHHWKVQEPRTDLQGATAACWLVRREAWLKVGGFHTPYRSYFEDIDLCLRVREAGYLIAYQPRARLVHQVGASQPKDLDITPQRTLYLQRNQGRLKYDEFSLL